MRVYRRVSTRKGQSITICIAISPRVGLVHYENIESGITREKCANYLQVTCRDMYVAHNSLDGFAIFDNAPRQPGFEDLGLNGILDKMRPDIPLLR